MIATVRNTPTVRLERLGHELPRRLASNHEGDNPYDSVKDRVGAGMIDDAVERGQ